MSWASEKIEPVDAEPVTGVKVGVTVGVLVGNTSPEMAVRWLKVGMAWDWETGWGVPGKLNSEVA